MHTPLISVQVQGQIQGVDPYIAAQQQGYKHSIMPGPTDVGASGRATPDNTLVVGNLNVETVDEDDPDSAPDDDSDASDGTAVGRIRDFFDKQGFQT